MSNKTTKRPTISFKGSHELMNTLDSIALQKETTRSDVLENLVTKALDNQIQKKPTLDTPVNPDNEKKTAAPHVLPNKKGFFDFLDDDDRIAVRPEKEGWFDFLLDDDDRARVAARLEKKGPLDKRIGKALNKALDNPDKLIKDTAKAITTMRTVSGLAALAAILSPIILDRMRAAKKAKAEAEQAAIASAPKAATTAGVVGTMPAGKDSYAEMAEAGLVKGLGG